MTVLDKSIVTPRQQGMSISFTNPSEGSANDSFTIDELRSPSPRQASVSVSFSTSGSNDCPMDYSDDIDSSFGALPISPVSHEEDENNHQNKSPRSSDPSDGPSQEAEREEFTKTATHESNEESNDSNEGINEDNVDPLSIQLKNADGQASVPAEVSAHSWKQTSDCNKRNATGQSALSISSSNCFLEGVKLLIEKGAYVNLQDIHGRSPLHFAVENKEAGVHHHCVEYLLEKGADINLQDTYGRTPLHIASKEGCAKCIHILLGHGARTDTINSEGDTPLHITAKMGHFTCMAALSPEVCCDDESHSSVESTSPSLLFDHESINNDVAGSFYQSPREMHPIKGSFRRSRHDSGIVISAAEEQYNDDINQPDMLPYSNLRETLRRQNDSGYFTARGSAWVKSKYYDNEKIEEERESSIASSTISDVDGKYEIESEGDSSSRKTECANCVANRTWLFQCLEFLLRVVLYLLHALLTWSKQPKKKVKPGDSNYLFVQPPDHVAEAMERLIRNNPTA